MVRKLYKSYYRCSAGDVVQGVFGVEVGVQTLSFNFNGVRNSDGTYSAAPAWFTQVNDFPLYDTWWIMSPPAEDDTVYDFSWTAQGKTGIYTEYIVRLTMLDYCSIELGCDTPNANAPLTMLLWLTREGGWTYFPFNGRKSFEVKIPDADTYMDGNYITRNYSRRGVANGETLTTGDIPELSLDLLQSLKESIQVFFVENPLVNGSQIYHEVNLMDGDFIKKKTGEKRWDFKVKFLYAQERVIQNQ